MKRPPLLLGGQGRSARSIRRDATGLGWLVLLALALAALLMLRSGNGGR